MVDRDPVTEPAGDMVAAQKLVEVLSWIDEGSEERFYMLAEVMLGWKGKRLRDAIAETGVVHLGKRQTNIDPQTPPEFLSRLARAAGLVFSGPALEHFVAEWLALAPGDEAFLQRRLHALGGLLPLLTRRRERDLAPVGLTLLECRDQLPPEAPSSNGRGRRVDVDGLLAEHLYRQYARQDPEAGQRTRAWFCAHGDYLSPDKHRIAREAAVFGHWDLIEAFFASGVPFGADPSQQGRKLPQGAQQGDMRTRLCDYIVERTATEAPRSTEAITRHAAAHLEARSGDTHAMLEWLLALARHSLGAEGPSRAALALARPLRQHLQELRDSPDLSCREAADTLCQLTDTLWG